MNQVPWRRILERAGDEGPGERGASVINLRDHAPDRQQNRRRAAGGDPSDLESELQQALNRAQRGEREHAGRQAPQRRDERGARGPEMRSAPMLRPDLAMQRQPSLAVAPPPQQKTSSGARNFLAISLSAAVIGFALYQIGLQWKEMNDGPEASHSAAGAPENFAAALTGAGTGVRNVAATENDARQRTFDGNRIDLRPSFAGETGTPARGESDRQASLDRDIAEAATLMSRGEPKAASPSVQPTAAPAAASEEGMEQVMLRRGHDMMKTGRIESARLLFEHLAEQKSALGAFALAQTYDPKFLEERGITKVAPDQKLAAEWYQRAAELTMAGAR